MIEVSDGGGLVIELAVEFVEKHDVRSKRMVAFGAEWGGFGGLDVLDLMAEVVELELLLEL